MDSDPQINISRIKVAGVGGFGLVVVVAAMAFDLPAVRIFLIAAVCGGFIAAIGLLLYHRWREARRPLEPPSTFALESRPSRSLGKGRPPVGPTRCSLQYL